MLCITSLYDGTPNVMGEAMSFGIPVLAPKNVGSTNFYLKNGKFGYLYKNENSNSFKKKILEILSDYKRAKKKLSRVITVCLDLIKKRLYLNY